MPQPSTSLIDLSGRVALVTGAARGIGRASALGLARAGAAVAGLDIAGPVSGSVEVQPASADDLAETGRLVQEAGVAWSAHRVDQRDIVALRGAAAELTETHGGVDIVHANAGIQAFSSILEMDDADWHDQIEVNLNGTPTGDPRRDEETARQGLIAKTPLGVPWVTPDDVAPLVVFLASDAARMVSGTSFAATGGDSANVTA